MGLLAKLFRNKSEKNTLEKTEQYIKSNNSENEPIVRITNNMNQQPDIPQFQGDYAKTIFLYATSKSSPVKADSDYVKYLLYECGIREPARYHRQMIEEGYLQASTIEDMVTALKMDILKEILKQLGLPVSGKKAELVERIMNANNEEIIHEYCRIQTYAISEKGKQFLQDHDAYLMLHRNKNWGISWKEYDQCRREGYGFYDTIWGILNKRVVNEPTMGLMRCDYYNMYEVLYQEGKRKNALEMLLRVIYIDFSGVCGMEFWDLYTSGVYSKKEILDTYDVAVMIAPGLINSLDQYKDIFDPSIVDHIYEFKLPFCCCDQKLFLSIISSIMNETYDEEAVNNKLKAAYRKCLKERLGL